MSTTSGRNGRTRPGRPRPAPASSSTLPAEVLARLGDSGRLWQALIDRIAADHAPVHQEVKAASKGAGYIVRLARRSRTILYLLPRDGFFLTAFVFGERAAERVRASRMPAGVIAALEAARPYAEGRGVRLETRTPADVETTCALAEIKMTP